MVKEKLRGSRFNTAENLEEFSQRFDDGVKKVFSNNQTPQYVKFATLRDNDPAYGIKGGRLTLTGAQVAGFFEPSVQSTADTIRDNFKQRLPANSIAFLVGGFATSPWLSEQLESRLLGLGFQFCKPSDMHTNKAVAIGAVSYYIDHFVTSRITQFTYGVPCYVTYNPSSPEHVQRSHKTFFDAAGDRCVPGHFISMLSRGTKVTEDREIRHSFRWVTEDTPAQHVLPKVAKYTGTQLSPEWEDAEPGKFETLCHVKADVSTAPYTSKYTTAGKMSYQRNFDVILLVGLTELKAQVSWTDSTYGTERRSGAVVVYDDPS